MNIMKKLRQFKSNEEGASMVEYGVALLVVTAVGVTLMNTLGTNVAANVEEACETVGAGGAVGAVADCS
jgi:Flp pilus assembly pilin Flp